MAPLPVPFRECIKDYLATGNADHDTMIGPVIIVDGCVGVGNHAPDTLHRLPYYSDTE